MLFLWVIFCGKCLVDFEKSINFALEIIVHYEFCIVH